MSTLKKEKGELDRKLTEAQDRLDSVEVERDIERKERQIIEQGIGSETKTKLKDLER